MTRSLTVIVFLLAGVVGCNENAAHVRMTEARRMTADLAMQFARSADASDRAVMADTDEASANFAREAQVATEAVQTHAAALAQLLKSLSYSDETKLLEEFERQFSEYRQLNSNILALAVEGTNLKAQRLSFGEVQKEADALRDALERLVPANAGDSWRLKALAATVLASAREIQVLQAPHIAEPEDAAMTRLETRMAAAQATARDALATLGTLVAASSAPQVASANAAMDELSRLNSQLQTLSRRNTNVRALALALGQKQTLTASCETALRALQEAVARRGLPTR